MNFDLETIKRKLMIKYPLFGTVVSNVSFKEEKRVKVAATDGKQIYYNSSDLKNFGLDEQLFIFAHEICHVAFNHPNRGKDKNLRIHNMATDYVINALLKKDGLTLPEGVLYREDAINYSSDEMYEILLEEFEENYQLASGGDLETPENTDFGGHENHELWDKPLEDNMFDELLEEFQEELSEIPENVAFEENSKEKKENLDNLKNSLVKESALQDKKTNRAVRNINEVGKSKGLINWTSILENTIGIDLDWSYRNPVIENGVVNPTLEEQIIPEVEILLDTSGSIEDELLRNFLRECKNIIRTSKVKVGCFDTEFYGFQSVEDEFDIETLEFAGGGDTDFEVAANSFTGRTTNKIIFTDGDAEMPADLHNIIWIVFGDKEISPKGGRVIRIPKEKLSTNVNYSKTKLR